MLACQVVLGLKTRAVLVQLALQGGRAHGKSLGNLFQACSLAHVVTQVLVQPVEQAGLHAQRRQLPGSLLLSDLHRNRRRPRPRLSEAMPGQAHHVQRATEHGVFAQMNPVLFDVTRLFVTETALPRQPRIAQ
ncbi:hypothetical protein ALP92_200071 [Pseudomonas syringae pv. primulae]|uniref:Uncharacterized protein n=1 Tax=Pseudomonas syringae pv. primulae TaxID=251707 RepID=A0A3M4SFV3_9PSED|nr:hypothetical protein ALP92_200071 [Pseudomonas syringae pv. primulae]